MEISRSVERSGTTGLYATQDTAGTGGAAWLLIPAPLPGRVIVFCLPGGSVHRVRFTDRLISDMPPACLSIKLRF